MTEWTWSAQGRKNFRSSALRVYVDASVKKSSYGIGVCIMLKGQVFIGMTSWTLPNLPSQNILAEFLAVHVGLASTRLLSDEFMDGGVVTTVFTDCKRIHKYIRYGFMRRNEEVTQVLQRCERLRDVLPAKIVYLNTEARRVHPGYRIAHHLSRNAYTNSSDTVHAVSDFVATVRPDGVWAIDIDAILTELLKEP